MLEKLIQDALILFTTIDPIGTTALFTALTDDPAALSVELTMNALGIERWIN